MVIHYGDKENQVKFEESNFFSKYSCKTAVLSRRVWVVTARGATRTPYRAMSWTPAPGGPPPGWPSPSPAASAGDYFTP